MEPWRSYTSGYTSCIKLHGHPIIGPYMDDAKRREMAHYRELAISKSLSLEARKKSSVCSGDSDSRQSSQSLSSHCDETTKDIQAIEFESFPPLHPCTSTLEHSMSFVLSEDESTEKQELSALEANCDIDVAHTTASTDLSNYLDITLEDSVVECSRPQDFSVTSPGYVSLKQVLETPEKAAEEVETRPLVRQNSYTLLDGPSSLIMAHVERQKPGTSRGSQSADASPQRMPRRERDFSSADSLHALFSVPRSPARRSLFTSTSTTSSPMSSTPGRPGKRTHRQSCSRRSAQSANTQDVKTVSRMKQGTNTATKTNAKATRQANQELKSVALKKSANSTRSEVKEKKGEQEVLQKNNPVMTSPILQQLQNFNKSLKSPILTIEDLETCVNEPEEDPGVIEELDLVQQLKMQFDQQMTELLQKQKQDQERMRRDFQNKLLANLKQCHGELPSDVQMMDEGKENASAGAVRAEPRQADTFRPLHQNGQTPAHRMYSPREKAAGAVIVGAARGFLVRRLMRTERVRGVVSTIRDVTLEAVQLHREVGADVQPEDVELSRRLIHQLNALWLDFYDVFFSLSAAEQMAVIAHDRARLEAQAHKSRPAVARLSSATVRAMKRRQNTSDSSPTLSRHSSGTLSERSSIGRKPWR